MRAGGGGEAASWRPQHLPGTTKGPKGEGPCDFHREPWAVRPVTEFCAKTEVASGGKLDVEDVERGETHIRTKGLHPRDKTEVFIKYGHYGTNNANRSPDVIGQTHGRRFQEAL